MTANEDGLQFNEEDDFQHGQCCDCGCALKKKERKYYGFRCESCEQANMERFQDWQAGGSDPELDLRYGMAVPLQRLH